MDFNKPDVVVFTMPDATDYAQGIAVGLYACFETRGVSLEEIVTALETTGNVHNAMLMLNDLIVYRRKERADAEGR